MPQDVCVPGILLFCVGVVASLAASWLLVSRLERLGERAGFSEAWLGLVAALAADAPEITSSVVALARGQASVGAGVIIGSNVFNLAALLGLAAVVAGWVGFHRRVVRAVVTSLPKAVSAVYRARRGRGAAVLSTALNSNAINVVGGLLIPASLAGLGPGSGQGTLVAAWYAGLTVFALALAYRGRGLGRAAGTAIIAGYLAFVTALIITVEQGGVRPAAAVLPAAAIAAAGALLLARPAPRPAART